MASFLKVTVFLLLLLSIAALGLGLKLFGQREEIKGRVQLLEDNTLALAGQIEAEQAEDLIATDQPTMDTKITSEDLKRYYAIRDGQKVSQGEGTLEHTLKTLLAKSKTQYSRLNDTRTDLGRTRTDLQDTKAEKERVEGELADEKKLTQQQQEKIAAQTQEIEEKTTKIAGLQESQRRMEGEIEDQKDEIEALNDKVAEQEAKLKADQKYIAELEKYKVIAEGTDKSEPTVGTEVAKGAKGEVLLVNPEWNFVVLGITPGADVVPRLELLVHRQDQLVGKVRVSDVKPKYNLAVGEILLDWRKGTIEEGDYVLY